MIEVPNSPLFIQFSKYFLGKGRVGLKLDFPLAPWSEKYYERVKQELSKMSLKFSVVPTMETTVREFLTVDLGQDIDQAITLAKMILHSAFGLDQNQTFTLYFDNISHKDENIGF